MARDKDNFSFNLGTNTIVMRDGLLSINAVEIEDGDPDLCDYALVRRIALDAGYFDDETGLEVIDTWDED